MTVFSENLKYLLKKHNLSGATFINLSEVDVSVNTSYRIVRGETDPRLDYVKAVAEKFNIPIGKLVYVDISNSDDNNYQSMSTDELIVEIERQNAIIDSFRKDQQYISTILKQMGK